MLLIQNTTTATPALPFHITPFFYYCTGDTYHRISALAYRIKHLKFLGVVVEKSRGGVPLPYNSGRAENIGALGSIKEGQWVRTWRAIGLQLWTLIYGTFGL